MIPDYHTNNGKKDIEVIECSSEDRDQLQVFIDDYQQ
jgi:hypothetical protein